MRWAWNCLALWCLLLLTCPKSDLNLMNSKPTLIYLPTCSIKRADLYAIVSFQNKIYCMLNKFLQIIVLSHCEVLLLHINFNFCHRESFDSPAIVSASHGRKQIEHECMIQKGTFAAWKYEFLIERNHVLVRIYLVWGLSLTFLLLSTIVIRLRLWA